jgi:hypothetical protein
MTTLPETQLTTELPQTRLTLHKVSTETPPLQTTVILWSLFKGSLVETTWVQARRRDLIKTDHINFNEPGVNPQHVWVADNWARPMKQNDLWSLIRLDTEPLR